MTVYWKFHDELGGIGSPPDWTFPVNPVNMIAPEIVENLNANPVNIDGTHRDVPSPATSPDWSWEGQLYTLADLDAMQIWVDWGQPIHVTDHFGQVWRIQLKELDAVRAPWRHYPQRHKYSANALMLGRVS